MSKDESVAGFDAPWEDSLIIAVRDMQWRKMLERLSSGKLTALPAPLFKLGGTTENAIGDVSMSVENRFYLLEFKRDAKRAGDEIDKPLIKFFKLLALASPQTTVMKAFLKDSKLGHHFAFSEQTGVLPSAPNRTRSVAISIQTAPYCIEADKMTETGYVMNAVTEISQLLYPKRVTQGLTALNMIAYIETLIAAHQKMKGKDKGSYQFKGALASDDGFFWPWANMDALVDLQLLLRGRLDADSSDFVQVCSDRFECILDIVPPLSAVAAPAKKK